MTPIRYCLFLFLMLAIFVAGCGKQESLEFNIEAGNATLTLVAFAEQAGVEILLDDENINRYRTNPVSGQMTPLKALELMTKGTGLNFTHDQSSNAFAVSSDQIHEDE